MIINRRRTGWASASLLIMLAASVMFGASSASAERTDPPGHRGANHCLTELGVDLNELYGISDQFRTLQCQDLTAGEHWIRPLWWITNFGVDSVYPAGYVPSRPNPVDDFVAKLVSINIVFDPDTPRERTLAIDPSRSVRTDIDAEQLEPGAWGAPYPMASMLPRVRPLSVGDHIHTVSIVLSAEHCDGFTTEPDFSCLPAGETLFIPARALTVHPPAP